MPTTINASNTTGGAVVTGDGSGILELQSGGVTGITVNGANVAAAGNLTTAGNVVVGGTLTATGGIPQITTALTSPVSITGNSTAGAEIRLPEDTDNGSNYVAIKAPNALAANVTFTLPTADGTNGQFLQTNGSGQLGFASLVSGKTQFTASGSITAGRGVVINGNDTAKAVDSFSFAVGAQNAVASGTYSSAKTFYLNDSVVLFYFDNNGNQLKLRIGTISGETITWGGTTYTIGGATSGSWDVKHVGNGKFASTRVDLSNYFYGELIQVTGVTATIGSSLTINTSMSYSFSPGVCPNAAGDAALFIATNSAQTVVAIYGLQISGMTLSNTASAFISGGQTATNLSMVFDGTRFIFAFRSAGTNSLIYAAYYVSGGGTVSLSGTLELDASATNSICLNSGASSAIQAIYSTTVLRAKNITASGTTSPSISLSSAIELSASIGGSSTIITASYNSYSQKYLIMYYSGSPFLPNFAEASIGSGVGTFANIGTAAAGIRSYSSGDSVISFVPNSPYAIVPLVISASGNLFVSRITTVFSDASLWAGIAESSVANGQTFFATVSGGVNPSVSGLTAGIRYYLTSDGQLTSSITAIPVGIAKSTTSILIDRG